MWKFLEKRFGKRKTINGQFRVYDHVFVLILSKSIKLDRNNLPEHIGIVDGEKNSKGELYFKDYNTTSNVYSSVNDRKSLYFPLGKRYFLDIERYEEVTVDYLFKRVQFEIVKNVYDFPIYEDKLLVETGPVFDVINVDKYNTESNDEVRS